MDHWNGILKVPLSPNAGATCKIAASLCVAPSQALVVPTANVIFFTGDRVEGTGNPVIERMSDMQNIAKLLVSKFGASINAWVIEASTFNGPFAVYKEFVNSLNQWGEPQSYIPDGFPASTSVITLLSNFLEERAKNTILNEDHLSAEHASSSLPKTIILGFSKGGVILNQILTEIGYSNIKCREEEDQPQPTDLEMESVPEIAGNQIVPVSRQNFWDSITEIHYVDVGLNSRGAYLTDDHVVQRITELLVARAKSMRIVLHGTPRQWSDTRRPWIREEKDKFLQLLINSAGQMNRGELVIYENAYFAELFPSLEMHFEIIEALVVS